MFALIRCTTFLCVLLSLPAWAETYPTKPIRIIVGFAPGGANDILARIIAPRLAENLGQPVIVENRPGGAGVSGSALVASAASDGHTLLLGSTGTQSILPSLLRTMPYDPVKGLLPISLVGTAGTVLVVNAKVPAQSVRELIALAKAKPGQLTFASSGTGTTLHLGGELFKRLAAIEMLHVPYKGNAPALADVVSGQVDMMFSAAPLVLPLAKAGKLRMLGVSTRGRITGLDEVPLIAESGVPDYEMSTSYGVFATGGTSAEIAEHLSAEIRKVVAKPEVREQILAQGIEPKTNRPDEYRKLVNDEFIKWAKVIKATGIQAD